MYEPKTKPFDHQITALRASWGREFFAYLMEMGTGKTKVAIDEMCMLFEDGRINGALILAPKGVYMNWVNHELPAHVPDRVASVMRVVEWRPGGGGVRHTERLQSLLDERPGLRVLVMNVEALSTGDKAYKFVDRFLRGRRCYMAVDESTTIKNVSSARTKSVIKLGALARYRRIMTGSPVTASPMDLWGQFEFLKSGCLGSTTFYGFRSRYCVLREMRMGGRKFQVPVATRNLDDLQHRVSKHSYRVTKDQCLTLPPKIYTIRNVELTPEQERAYSEMRAFSIMSLENESVVSSDSVLKTMMKLQQIVCGFVISDDGSITDIPSNKITELLSVLSETSRKVIIWCSFRHEVAKIASVIRAKYGEESVAEFHGGNTKTRDADSDRFKTDPSCRFMVSTQSAGGFGNTWVVAKTVVYYNNHHSLLLRMQSEDRPHRAGQDESVTYVDLVADGTVERKILHALRNNINLATTITGDNFREWVI